MLDTDVARHGLCLRRGLATASAIDLASSPLGDITLAETHPAGRAPLATSWWLAADAYSQLLLCLLLALLLMSRPGQQQTIQNLLACATVCAFPNAMSRQAAYKRSTNKQTWLCSVKSVWHANHSANQCTGVCTACALLTAAQVTVRH